MAEEKMTPRVRPHSEEAEQAVLGSMLMDRDAVNTVMEILEAEDFYNERHRVIYRGMQDLYRENRAIDLITLKDRLEQGGTLETIGGLVYLGQIAAAVPSSVNAKHYAQIVKDKAQYRRFISIGETMVQSGYAGEMPISELSENVEKDVFQILSHQRGEGFSHIHDVLLETYEDIERIASNPGTITGVPTGFTDLDRQTTGLQPSDLVLLGARPSMGKTAFALNIVQHAAVREHRVCAIFSLEMSKKQLANRLLCAESLVDSERIRRGTLENEDWEKLLEALAPLSESPI